MSNTAEAKKTIVEQHKVHAKDTGSTPVQIALLTSRIQYLTEHLKVASKDYASRHGLFKLVGRRRHLLDYFKRHNPQGYQQILQQLDLRK